jgi:membrane protein DedA with SNARE-associated domain
MELSTDTLQHLLSTWGYLAVFVFVAVESSGIPFPGETMLVTAAAYAGAGHIDIFMVIGAGAAGAIIGDNIGYLVGRTGGREIVERYGKYVRLDDRKLASAERFFDRHGDKTVFLGRFVAVLRAWAAFLAGLNRMRWNTFLFFNAAGGIVWATTFGLLAYSLGKNLPLLHQVMRTFGIAGIVAAIVLAVVMYVLHRRARKRRRDSAGTTSDQSPGTQAGARRSG